MGSTRLLVVEDDAAVRRGLVDTLRAAGHEVEAQADGPGGLEAARGGNFDLVLLDVGLPGLDGFALLERLRKGQPRLPVILLTARGAESDRVRGLRGGADDYVVKPFGAAELLARVEAVLRRVATQPEPLRALEIAGRRIDFERRLVRFADGSSQVLSDREAELLAYLAANPGRAVPRDELLRSVWGLDPRGIVTRTVDMAVARLREALRDDPQDPQVVATVRSRGYMLAAAENSEVVDGEARG